MTSPKVPNVMATGTARRTNNTNPTGCHNRLFFLTRAHQAQKVLTGDLPRRVLNRTLSGRVRPILPQRSSMKRILHKDRTPPNAVVANEPREPLLYPSYKPLSFFDLIVLIRRTFDLKRFSEGNFFLFGGGGGGNTSTRDDRHETDTPQTKKQVSSTRETSALAFLCFFFVFVFFFQCDGRAPTFFKRVRASGQGRLPSRKKNRNNPTELKKIRVWLRLWGWTNVCCLLCL